MLHRFTQYIRHSLHQSQHSLEASCLQTLLVWTWRWGEYCFVYFVKPFMNVRVLSGVAADYAEYTREFSFPHCVCALLVVYCLHILFQCMEYRPFQLGVTSPTWSTTVGPAVGECTRLRGPQVNLGKEGVWRCLAVWRTLTNSPPIAPSFVVE